MPHPVINKTRECLTLETISTAGKTLVPNLLQAVTLIRTSILDHEVVVVSGVDVVDVVDVEIEVVGDPSEVDEGVGAGNIW